MLKLFGVFTQERIRNIQTNVKMVEKGVPPDLVNQFAHPIDSLTCDEETTPSEISQQTLGSSTTRTGKFFLFIKNN
jgi:hypothetical protein